MTSRFAALVLAAIASVLAAAGAANAHPHVWVTMTSELVYAPDGSLTGVRQVWTFDDMYSAFATQGLESKKKGEFTREELAPLAEVNVTSLKDFDYFTAAKVNDANKKDLFGDPTDYWLEYKDSMLTLRFMLPLKTPLQTKSIEISVFDPEYFVDFTFTEKDPVALVNAPAQCKLALFRPEDPNSIASQTQRLDRSFAPTTDAFSGMGSQFSNKMTVTCP